MISIDSKLCTVLDPDSVAQREHMRAVCRNLLLKYGPKKDAPAAQGSAKGVGDPVEKPKGCGRATGPPIQRKAMTKERKELLKGAVERRSLRFQH